MDLPVEYPSEAEVIPDDVARFRGDTGEERVRSHRGFLAPAARIARISPKASWAA